jgi:hypothetical protein
MMTCEEIRLAMGAHALGALDPDEALEVDTHLATCEDCGAELLELEGVAAFLGKVSERDVELVASPPRQVLDRLLNARVKRYRRGRLLLAVAASVAVIAVGGTMWTVVQQNEPQTTSAAAPRAEARPSTASKLREESNYAQDGPSDNLALKSVPTPTPSKKTSAGGRVFSGENQAKDYYATVTALPNGDNGTQLLVAVKNVPIGTTCALAVYDGEGQRLVAGSWNVTRESYQAKSVFELESPVLMRDIARFEVVDQDGRVLVNVPAPARK